MGIKGAHLLIWAVLLVNLLMLLAASTKWIKIALLLLEILMVLCVIYFYFRTQIARRQSKQLGLSTLVLLPVSNSYITGLLRLAKESTCPDFLTAYELHVNQTRKIDPKEFNQLMINDLELIKQKLNNALFIWETNVPIPGEYRRLIRQAKQQGNAFWRTGRWPIKAPPFTGRRKFNKKYVRYGWFVLNTAKEERNEQ